MRLAQNMLVRIRIIEVPPGIPLVSGLTATVTLRKDAAGRGALGPFDGMVASVREVFSLPSPALTPEQIDPGLADGLTAKPGRPRDAHRLDGGP